MTGGSSAITVRRAAEADAAAACDVLCRSIRELCLADHDGDERALAAWLADKTAETVRTWIALPSNVTVVATRGSEICGVALMNRAGVIHLCYVLPEVQFHGAGKRMLHALEAEAANLGLTIVTLTSSLTGRLFYERSGYVRRGEPVPVFGGSLRGYPMAKTLA